LIDSVGWLLYGLLGSVDPPGLWDVYTTSSQFAAGDNNYVPWMSFRKHIPGRTMRLIPISV